MVVAEFVRDLGVDLVKATSGCAAWILASRSAIFSSTVTSRVLGAGDAEGDDRLVEKSCEVPARRRRRSPSRARRAALFARRNAIGSAASRRCWRAGERADRCSWPATSPRPPPRSTLSAHLLVDRRGGDAEREQFFRIERDADLGVDAAIAGDLADAAEALQVARDGVVDEPGELLDRHARRGRIGDDRQALDIDAVDDGSSMVRGRSARILEIWSFTSLSARSMSTEPT